MDTLDIHSRNPETKLLSNFAITPFSFGGWDWKTAEGFIQALKTEDELEIKMLRSMTGIQAKVFGRTITLWDGKRIHWYSSYLSTSIFL